jgi:U5 small nuclear ribonucleoprotein component
MQSHDDELFYKQGNEIVLHEDKQYYTDASKVFGPNVRVLVNEEDAQPLSKPIVQPPVTLNFQLYDKELPQSVYDINYLSSLSQVPRLVRNVCIAGHLHHGKTLLCDMIFQRTHKPAGCKNWDPAIQYRFTQLIRLTQSFKTTLQSIKVGNSSLHRWLET